MKIKFTLTLLIMLLVCLASGATLIPKGVASGDKVAPPVVSIEPQTADAPESFTPTPPLLSPPFTDVTIPSVPLNGDCCLWQVEKKAEGKRTATFKPPYACPLTPQVNTPTMRGSLTLNATLSTVGTNCDQLPNLIPNNSVLKAGGQLIRRNDALMHFSGNFTIASPTGAALFTGWIETTDRIGSHDLPPVPPMNAPCEACNQTSHFEGWLVGQGVGGLANYSIRAMIVGTGTTPSPQNPSTAISVGRINGTLIKCP